MNVEQFLYHEARLLDSRQFDAWLDLFTEDAVYWVPLERDQADGIETSSIIHDDRTLLARAPELYRRRTRIPGSTIGSVSQATKVAQAVRDSRD